MGGLKLGLLAPGAEKPSYATAPMRPLVAHVYGGTDPQVRRLASGCRRQGGQLQGHQP